jgi:hypothetical protein
MAFRVPNTFAICQLYVRLMYNLDAYALRS